MEMRIGNRHNPLTIRLHEEFGMTWTEYAERYNFSYGQLNHVVNGRAFTPYIVEQLVKDGLMEGKKNEQAKV